MTTRGVPAAAPAMGAEERPAAKSCAVLLPVWGVAFVRQFLDFCLPTLLAPGNIPALAEALPTHFTLLTRSSDVPLIIEHPAWRQLARHCDTEVREIDDLIVDGNHHAAITLAYIRALRRVGAALRDTMFLFMVGDYLLANGSLRSVLHRIQAGVNGILAGSLAIPVDAAIPLLCHRGAVSHELVLPPRLLVDRALAALHQRGAGNAVNAGLLHDPEANRLFWSVDEHTLIGRFYLLHMIAIRPEVGDFIVGAPCDYSFIPELCPSGKVDVLTDSDDYLAIELQRDAAGDRRCSPVTAVRLARSLSQWTTDRQRQNAEITLVFHSREIPETIGQTCALASRFIGDVGKALTPQPQPHRGHPSWIGMMALQRAGDGLPQDCKLVVDPAASSGGAAGAAARLLWRLRLRVLGHPPNVMACHPRWPDFHALYATARSRLDPGDRLLVLSPSATTFARWLKPLCPHITASEWELLPTLPDESRASAPLFDACMWVADPGQLGAPGAILERIAQALKPGGRLFVFLLEGLDAKPLDANRIYASLGSHAQQFTFCIDQGYYVSAGRLRLAFHRNLAATMRACWGQPGVRLAALVTACALIAGAIFAGNQTVWRRRSGMPARGTCSSIGVAGRRADGPKTAIVGQNDRAYDLSK